MRVAHVLKTFLPLSETFVYTQLRGHEGLEQRVFARRLENESIFPPDGFDVDADAPEPASVGRRLRRLQRLRLRPPDPFPGRLVEPLRRFAPDVLHAHFGWAGAYALPAAEELGVPLVVSFHGRDVYAPSDSAARSYPALFAVGSAFAVVGPEMAEALRRRGARADRVVVVPLGVELERFPFRPAPPRRPLVLVQVGRLVPKKGVDATLEAFARARRRLGPSELWIVGDGPEREPLERLVAELGLADAVTFHGAVAPTRVQELLGRAHIGVQASRAAPSGDREGSPTTIIEMEARGVAVAATRHSDIPFIVPHPERLVPEGDVEALAMELVRLAELDPSGRDELLGEQRALVERQHDARRVRALLREVYAPAEGERRARASSPSSS